ncbi:MFS_1_like domain-containing protein [Caerostris extrusa]|uniref:MFS_1_like domain-containing protein n=1 Tax=Caerostris extrusa TaxID=172846 RepID=A0AAV4XT68_CAEEX|nr:MFS_1_like domain-containing protein [Caerostris extrusa]
MEEKKQKFCNINLKYLPIKLHYLVMYGGYGGVIPFSSLFGKGLGISATAIGLTNTTLMGLVLLFKPFLGSLVDYFRNLKSFLICLLLLKAVSCLCLLLIPPLEEEPKEVLGMRLQSSNQSEEYVDLPISFDKNCIEDAIKVSEIGCFVPQDENTTNNETLNKMTIEILLVDMYDKDLQNNSIVFSTHKSIANNSVTVNLFSRDSEATDLKSIFKSDISSLKCEPDLLACTFRDNTSSVFVYQYYQFWIFACLVILAGLGAQNASS